MFFRECKQSIIWGWCLILCLSFILIYSSSSEDGFWSGVYHEALNPPQIGFGDSFFERPNSSFRRSIFFEVLLDIQSHKLKGSKPLWRVWTQLTNTGRNKIETKDGWLHETHCIVFHLGYGHGNRHVWEVVSPLSGLGAGTASASSFREVHHQISSFRIAHHSSSWSTAWEFQRCSNVLNV